MDIYCSPVHPMDPNSMYSDSNGPTGVPDEPVHASELQTEDQLTELGQQDGCMKTQQWFQQNYYFDSGFQSMENSKPASIMSMNVPPTMKCPQRPITSPECQVAACDSTPMEPTPSTQIPANDSENARRVLPELIPLLDDCDEEVACRALEMVAHIAKLDAQQHYSEPVINDQRVVTALTRVLRTRFEDKKAIRVTLCTLFHISNREHGMDLILNTVEKNSLNHFLADLIRCIQVEENACFKYALLILHNLMTDKTVGRRVVDFARTQKAMAVIVDWLADRNEKLLAITVDILQLLCDRNSDQKTLFVNLNGPSHLCNILSWARYENLLWRTVRLMKSISIQNPKRLVTSGAFDVLPMSLDYPSQRIITESLVCVRDLSDVSTDRLDISPLLAKLVQLLVVNDARIRQLCVQALANLSANNRSNKEFLCSINVVGALKCVLFESEAQLEVVDEQVEQMTEVLEDIQENALTALRNLYSGHRFDTAVQQHILTENGAEFFLRKLVAMRPALLRKTLLILAKTASQPTNLPIFRHTRITVSGHGDVGGFVDRIAYVLFVAASKSADSQTVENINLTELQHLCMLTLDRLCADPNLHRQTIRAFKSLAKDFDKLETLPPMLALRQDKASRQGVAGQGGKNRGYQSVPTNLEGSVAQNELLAMENMDRGVLGMDNMSNGMINMDNMSHLTNLNRFGTKNLGQNGHNGALSSAQTTLSEFPSPGQTSFFTSPTLVQSGAQGMTSSSHLCLNHLQNHPFPPSQNSPTQFQRTPLVQQTSQMSVHQSNLQQSAILLLNRLKIDREIAAFFASDYETLDCLEHWSRSNSPIAEPAQRLLKQVKKMKYENLYDPFDRMKLSTRSRSISPFENNFQDSGFDENTVTSPNYSENSPNYRYGMEYMEGGMVGYGQKYSPGTPGSTFVNMAQPYSIPEMDDYPLASVFCSNSDGQSDEMAHVSFTHHGEMSQKNSPLLMQFSD